MPRATLCLPLLACVMAAAPPAPLTPDQAVLARRQDDLLARAEALIEAKRPAEGAALQFEAFRVEQRLWGTPRPRWATGIYSWASGASRRGDFAEAIELLTVLHAMEKAHNGPDQPRAIDVGHHLRLVTAMKSWTAGQRTEWDRRRTLEQEMSRHMADAQPEKALPIALGLRRLVGTLAGERSPEYSSALNNVGFVRQALGEYKEAEAAYSASLALCRDILGDAHPRTAEAINNLAGLLNNLGEHRKALPLFRQAAALLRRAHGEKHASYATALNNVAASHSALGNPREASALHERVLALRTALLGPRHPDTLQSMHNLATSLTSLGSFRRADPIAREAVRLRRLVHGERHPLHANSLLTHAILLKHTASAREALPVARKGERLIRDALGRKHPDHASALMTLAEILGAAGHHAEAADTARQAVAGAAALGERHPRHAAALVRLAEVLEAQGSSAEALQAALRAVALTRLAQGERHPTHVRALEALAGVHHSAGDHRRALQIQRDALALCREVQGEGSLRYATLLLSHGDTCLEIGDYARALANLHAGVKAAAAASGERSLIHANALSSLANALVRLGKPDQALATQQTALRTLEALGETGTQPHLAALTSLAVHYSVTGRYDEALRLAAHAAHLSPKTLGANPADVAAADYNLASVRQRRGEHALARAGFERGLGLIHSALGERHPHYVRGLIGLATSCELTRRRSAALPLAWHAYRLSRLYIEETAGALSEQQHLSLEAYQFAAFHLLLNLAGGCAHDEACHDALLATKAAVFRRQALRRLLLDEDDPETRRLIERVRQAGRQVAALTQAGPSREDADAWRAALQKSQLERERAEADLAGRSERFRAHAASPRSADVAAALPPGAALIDFVLYKHFLFRPKGDPERQPRLAAFIVRRGADPVRIDLGPAAPIAADVAAWRREAAAMRPLTKGSALRSAVWEPLLKYLGGADTVLISPDGFLSGLPFAALPGAKPGTYLIEDVAIASVAAPATLPALLAPAPAPAARSPLLVGAVEFGDGALWPTLPGTALEVEALEALARRAGGTPSALSGKAATRAAVRARLAAAPAAHLATHGFFTRLPSDAGERIGTLRHVSPATMSGLVLAGANAPRPGDDGLLTALEVSELDMRRCGLLVLSACETGLGVDVAGEGVLGLQRAFALAGARTTVTSLWMVSDASTSVLMEHFYAGLWGKEKLSKLEALRRAQLFVLRNPLAVERRVNELGKILAARGAAKAAEKLPASASSAGRSHPALWAAFVLAGDWR